MKLIGDIINDLIDNELSVTVALNKTKVLAARIGNNSLLDWANSELTGYAEEDLIPSYRTRDGTVKAEFIKGSTKFSNYPIQLNVGKENNQRLRQFKFSQSIVVIEGFASNHSGGALLYQYPNSITQSIESLLKDSNGPYFQLITAGVEVPANFAAEVISIVKNKLLDFMLSLEKEFGLESEIIDLKSNNSKINYFMNNTITNHGDGNVTNTGNNSTITSSIIITKGNKRSLAESLRKHDVEEEDINELIQVIDEEPPTSDGAFGNKVNSWVKKMLGKSLDTTWKVGIGAAGNLLATTLKLYYGIDV